MRQFAILLLFLNAATLHAEDKPADVSELIRQLGSDDFEKRNSASKELLDRGDEIGPALQQALAKTDDTEARGRIEELLKKCAAGSVVWDFEAGYLFGTPVVSGGKVYVANKDGFFFCLDAAGGKVNWKANIEGLMFHLPAVFDGKIITIRTNKDGRKDGTLFCLDASDGRTLWTHFFDSQYFTGPIFDGKRLYLCCEKVLYSMNPESGKIDWEFRAENSLLSSPTVSGDRILVGGLDKKLICVDAQKGEKIWDFETEEMITGGASISGDRAFAASQDGKIYCLEMKDGAKVWEFQTGSRVYAAPAIAGGRVYSGGDNGTFYCLDAEDGKPRWKYETGGTIYASPSVSDGRVCFGSINNKLTLHCLSAEDAKPFWTFETKEAGYAWPVLSGRRMFVGYHSKFYCLRSGLKGPAAWPMFCGNPARTGSNDTPQN